MKIVAFLRSKKGSNRPATIRFRVRDGRGVTLHHSSEKKINPLFWDAKNEAVKAKIVIDINERNEINAFVSDRKKLIAQIYSENTSKSGATSTWLSQSINDRLNPAIKPTVNYDFFSEFERFIQIQRFSQSRKAQYAVIIRLLRRFNIYMGLRTNGFALTFDSFTKNTLIELESYYYNEHIIYYEFPVIFEEIPYSRRPVEKGHNTISGALGRINRFIHWSIDEGITSTNPFKGYKIREPIYGSPVYITIDERNHLYNYDFSENNKVDVVRDIFIFQCFIGCRVSDLFKFTKKNIVNGALEYIARKTRDDRPVTVSIPLSSVCIEIMNKYESKDTDRLLPEISLNEYNIVIKKAFKEAGLTRNVAVLNKKTGEPITSVLWREASSHMARRTFIGNLYKKVKDPNLISSLSGHKDGSRAFARYRYIDDEIKRELINLIE